MILKQQIIREMIINNTRIHTDFDTYVEHQMLIRNLQDPEDGGWIYCVNTIAQGVYKCGFSKKKVKRAELDYYLRRRYITNVPKFKVICAVPVSNARVCEKLLFKTIEEYRVGGEHFKVDDVDIIIKAMNKLPI